ncbi:peroxisome membrane protein [Helicostylum pulchrum]|nr:peroxisome membrane protein [Helicostylum pulchrum]
MLPSSLLHFTNKQKKEGGFGYSVYIDTIEDTIRALSLLLPGRFEDGDLCSQAILAGLNLISLYHTKFLVQTSLKNKEPNQPTTSFNDRFNQFNKSRLSYKTASWTLSIISYTEVVIEMILNRKLSNTSRWKWVASMEGLKAILRLILFYGTKRKMVLHPTHFIRNIDPTSLDVCQDEKFELLALDPRTGTALSINNSDSGTIACKSRRGWAQVAELLWIIRPFIYAFMIMMEQRKKSIPVKSKQEEEESIEKDEEGSWKPWVVSLSIDIIARIARHMQPMSNLEKDESKRRDYLFIYYLFRGPIYLKFTRILLDKFCNATEHQPLISIVTAAINDYRPFWEDSYFYTAAS